MTAKELAAELDVVLQQSGSQTVTVVARDPDGKFRRAQAAKFILAWDVGLTLVIDTEGES